MGSKYKLYCVLYGVLIKYTCSYNVRRRLMIDVGLLSIIDLIATKPVFGVSDKVRLKPACSATGTT